MKNQNYTVFDLETTGFEYLKGDKIIEIGAIKIQDGKTQTDLVFNSLVYADIIDIKEGYFLNFFNPQEILQAPKLSEVMEKFIDFVKDDILIAHNADFDISFLRPEWESHAPFTEFPTTLCSKEMDKIFYPSEKFHNLDVVCARWGVDLPINRHRAFDDVVSTAKVVEKMLNSGKIKSLNEILKTSAKHMDYRHKY